MLLLFRHRAGHYAMLVAVVALLTLPNLGAFSLFDYDEGVNAEASREMLEANNWLVPKFNFELRTAKPIMLYWLQMTSFEVFGVSEFAARFPSVLASLLTVLLTYELGRSMFGATTGLLAGLVLSSAIYFCLMSHAATPDAVLLSFTMLTYFCYWQGSRNGGRAWFIPTGMAAGLAVLTKGPVGLALPGLVVLLHLAWMGQLRRLWDRRLLYGFLAFAAVALPWYVLVTVETRGTWLSAFFGRENLQRFSSSMENHSGPIVYHLIGLLVFFAPWSLFMGVALWYGYQDSRSKSASTVREGIESHESTQGQSAIRLLICWFGAYLVFFSVAATKLPNYVLPLYPALALLTARFVDRWRTSIVDYPKWIMPVAWTGMILIGCVAIIGLLVAGGTIPIPSAKMRIFPGLEQSAIFGAIPILAGGLGFWLHRNGSRTGVVVALTLGSILFVGSLAATAAIKLDSYKAPEALVRDAEVNRPGEDVKIAGLYYFQPSLVYYAGREVKKLESYEQSRDFLRLPYRSFLFVPEPIWRDLAPRADFEYRIAARSYDFLKNCEVLVLTNR